MNPFLLIALLGGGFLLYKTLATTNALELLQVQVVKFQIYKVNTSSGLTFRVVVKFANLTNTAINIDRVYATAYIDTDGKSSRVCVLDSGGFSIPGNQTVEQEFFVQMTWLDATISANNIAQAYMSGGQLSDIRIVGVVRALGQTVEFENIIPISR